MLRTGQSVSPECAESGEAVEFRILYDGELGDDLEFVGACATPTVDEWYDGAECVGGGQVPDL